MAEESKPENEKPAEGAPDPKAEKAAEKARIKAEKKAAKAEKAKIKADKKRRQAELRRKAWNEPLTEDGSFIFTVRLILISFTLVSTTLVALFFWQYRHF